MAEEERIERDRSGGLILGLKGKAAGVGSGWLWLLALLAVFAAAFAWRWYFASRAQIYTYDSYYYMVLARNLRHLSYSVAGHPHFKFMPLYPISIAFLDLFVPGLEMAGKLSNVLFTSACIFPIYAIGRLVFNRRAGMAAALLFAFEPVSTAWSSVPMSEGLFTLLVCLAALFFLKWMKEGGRSRMWWCAAFTGLSMVTRWEGFLLLGVLGLFILGYWWKGRLRFSHLAAFGAIALAPFALLLLRNVFVFGIPVKSAYLSEIGEHPEVFEPLNHWGRLGHYLLFSDLQTIGISSKLYNFGYLLVGYGGLVLALAVRRVRPYALFLWAWLLILGPLHFLWYFLSVRFMFPAAPVICLGGGALLGVPWTGEIWERGRRGAAVFLGIAALAFIAVLALVGRPVTNDMFVRNIRYLEDDTGGLAAKEAILWLKDNAGEAGVASNIGPITSFYLGRDAFFLGGWQDFEEADIRPDHLLEDARDRGVRYILVYSWDTVLPEYEGDPEGRLKTALEYAGVDAAVLAELRLVDTWFAPPEVEGNWPVYAYILEVPGVGGAP